MNTLTSVGPGVRAAVVPAAPGGNPDEPFPILTIPKGTASDVPATLYKFVTATPRSGVTIITGLTAPPSPLAGGYANWGFTTPGDATGWVFSPGDNGGLTVTPPADTAPGLYLVAWQDGAYDFESIVRIA